MRRGLTCAGELTRAGVCSQAPAEELFFQQHVSKTPLRKNKDNSGVQYGSCPADQCWVLADNEDLQPSQAADSRSFGPLHVDHVLGRILYFVRSQTEHGPVENSTAANVSDLPVLEAELDVEKLVDFRC